MAIVPHVYPSARFKPLKDFTAVTDEFGEAQIAFMNVLCDRNSALDKLMKHLVRPV